jgi:hypothetical protein
MAELHCRSLPPHPNCGYKADEGTVEAAWQDVMRHRHDMHPEFDDVQREMTSHDRDEMDYLHRHPENLS